MHKMTMAIKNTSSHHCPSLLSVCTVCVCACVRIFCIIMIEHLSIYTSFFWITFSISMYVMCVYLFSALSHRVRALQISIIIIILRLVGTPDTCKMEGMGGGGGGGGREGAN